MTRTASRQSGTVTLLFTDIEGSTARWDADRAAMASALARHDALLRATLESRGACIFKTVGDAFCATFGTVRDAISAALEAQRALEAEDFSAVQGLRVRMAVHVGAVEERDGDYFGPTVNRVARLLAVGHGGQVLLTGAAAAELEDDMPAETRLRDLGEHRLRDLAQTERVYQLLAPKLPESFPPLLSIEHLTNNLPRQVTSFVGREDVTAQVKSLIEQFRIVTLVGAGGSGKTRCAVQIGTELLEAFVDGVWLAELAPVSDPSLVVSAVARALNLREQPNLPLLETAITYLKRKRLLLIVDNCEHVRDEAASMIAAITQSCPDVRILATSREPLNLSGEHTYRMPSLPVPPVAELTAQSAMQYGAVALFNDRAAASDSRFILTDEQAADVTEICRRLDGIPLAIELAAARVRILSPKQLVQKLNERFRILTGGDKSALPRHRTMRALIDWSYDLLATGERALFRKLAIFSGGFTLESAAAIAAGRDADDIEVLDRLSSLVDKSLVLAEPAGNGTRYRLLESTREYAREKLQEAEELEPASAAHAAVFCAMAEELEGLIETTADRDFDARAEPEIENFRAALEWAISRRGDVLLGQRLAAALRPVWSFFGAGEGMRWVRDAQDCVVPDTPARIIAALDFAEAQLASLLVQHRAGYAAAERALSRFRELGDPLGIAQAQRPVGWGFVLQGKIPKGEAILMESLSAARALGARRLEAAVLGTLGNVRDEAGDLNGARRAYAETLNCARAFGFDRLTTAIASNLAEAEFRGGNAAAALRLLGEVLRADRAQKNPFLIATDLANESAYLVAIQRYDEARDAAREALIAARDARFGVEVAHAVQHLAAVAALRPASDAQMLEDCRRAARLLGYVDARMAALEALREYTEQQESDAMLRILGDALGANVLSELMNEGAAWSEDRAVAEAMQV